MKNRLLQQRPGLVIPLLAAAALFALLPRGTEARDGVRLRLFYSTDFLGALEPCG